MAGEMATCECGSTVQVPDATPSDTEQAGDSAVETSEEEVPRDGWYVDTNGESVGPKSLQEVRQLIESGELAPSQKVYHRTMDNWQTISSVPALASSSMPVPESIPSDGNGDQPQWYVRVGGSKYGPYRQDRVRKMLDKNQLRPDSQIWSSELGEWKSLQNVEPFASMVSASPPPTPGTGDNADESASSHPKSSSEENVTKEKPSEEETTRNETTEPSKRRKRETSQTGLTTNLKGLFQRGDRGKAKGAQVPSTVLTVEYVDDTEGIETYLKDIVMSLESLQEQTEQVEQYVSRLARAMNQQKKRHEKSMQALRRRIDRLYSQLENMPQQPAAGEEIEPPPAEEEEGPAPEDFGVPEEFSNDDAHHRAWQVAEVMASDLEVYHEDELEEGVRYGNLEDILEEPIAEARETYQDRTPERVREEVDYFDMALRKLVAQKKREMNQEEVS